MREEDVWFTILKAPGQRRMTPRRAKGVLIFVGTLLGCLIPLTPAILLVVFRPSYWWVIPIYLVWATILIVNLVRIVRAHSETIDLNEAIDAWRARRRGGPRA